MNTVGTYHNRDRRPMHTSHYHSVQVREIDEGIYYYIWTHKKFEIISEGRRKLQLGESIAFSYEVIWKKSDTKFEV